MVGDFIVIVMTAIAATAGLRLAHMAGMGLVLQRRDDAPLNREGIERLERHISPAEIAWDDGPFCGCNGELCYPIHGELRLKEVNGQRYRDATVTVLVGD